MVKQTNQQARLSTKDHLADWYAGTAVGKRLHHQIISELDSQLERLFGYHTLFLGVPPNVSVEDLAHSQTKLVATPDGTPVKGAQSVLCFDEALPFDTESIDTVVVFHGFEVCDEPHQALREAHRVLVPNGNLIIVGFNPETLFGLGWLINRFVFPAKWRGLKLERIPKLMDWLSLLNFQVAKPRHKLVIRPIGNGRLFNWMARFDDWLIDHQVPMGGAFVLHARKQVGAGIKGLQRQKVRPKLVAIPVSRPAVGAETHQLNDPAK